MPKVAITEQYLEDIADAIREKTGMSTATYYPSEMAPAILTISGGGGITPTGTISITENGTHNVTTYAYANVQVPTGGTPVIDSLSVTPTESAQTFNSSDVDGYKPVTVSAISSDYVGSNIARRSSTNLTVSGDTVTAPAGYYASSASKAVASGTAGTPTASKGTVSNHSISVTPSVTNTTGYITGGTKTGTAVTVSASELVSGSEIKTVNGTYDVTNLAELVVNVSGGGSPTIQSLSVTPTESEQTFNSSSVDGYKPVTVGAISSTYVGSDITRRSSSDLTASGATVTVPVGLYSAQATKTIPNATLKSLSAICGAPTISVDSNGLITATASGGSQYYASLTSDGGYVAPNTEVTVQAVGAGVYSTEQLSIQAATTITPTTSSQTAVAAGKYTTGAVTVAAMPTMTLPTSASASATSGYTSKATISRSTSDQYINIPTGYNTAGGYYKINAVANGSATNSGSVSGSSATVSTGTNTITLTKSVSITPAVTAGYVSAGTAGNVSVALTANLVLQNYYTGSSAPSSSLGSNGDLYLQS